MPQWLSKQLMQAFYNKNRKQIRLLNDCWFFYYQSVHSIPSGKQSISAPSLQTPNT